MAMARYPLKLSRAPGNAGDMPKSDDELEKIADPTSPKIPEPTSPGAPYSLDPAVISGWHLLQIVGAIVIIYLIFHFLEKHW
jgi:hypothetical protein